MISVHTLTNEIVLDDNKNFMIYLTVKEARELHTTLADAIKTVADRETEKSKGKT